MSSPPGSHHSAQPQPLAARSRRPRERIRQIDEEGAQQFRPQVTGLAPLLARFRSQIPRQALILALDGARAIRYRTNSSTNFFLDHSDIDQSLASDNWPKGHLVLNRIETDQCVAQHRSSRMKLWTWTEGWLHDECLMLNRWA